MAKTEFSELMSVGIHIGKDAFHLVGFDPRISPTIYVKPFNKGQKNDYNDGEAIAKAALRPNLKTVSEKTQDQQDLQALHRVRSRLVSRWTATINQIRAPFSISGATNSDNLGEGRRSGHSCIVQHFVG